MEHLPSSSPSVVSATPYHSRDDLLKAPYALLRTYLGIPCSFHVIDNISTEAVQGGLSCIITRHIITYRSKSSEEDLNTDNLLSVSPKVSSFPHSFIIKTNRPDTTSSSSTSSSNDRLSANVGLAREALFYGTLSTKVLDTLGTDERSEGREEGYLSVYRTVTTVTVI